MFGDRAQLRETFFHAWEKFRAQRPLVGAERLIVEVASRHPEYHAILQDRHYREHDFAPTDTANPFLHLGMHVAIEEQLALDRPLGVRAQFAALRVATGDPHVAQHLMMECLGATLAQAQGAGRAPDEQTYLACLRTASGAGTDSG